MGWNFGYCRSEIGKFPESKGTHTIDGYRKGGPCDFSDSEHYCSADGCRRQSYSEGATGIDLGNEALFDLADIDDPSLGAVFRTSGKIVIVGLCVILFLFMLQISSAVDQIQSENWEKVSGTVTNAEWDYESNLDADATTAVVTVAYIYLGENYSTSTYSFVTTDWGEDPEHWLAIESIDIYVNPDNPSEAVYLAGWTGIMEEAVEGFSFIGLILGLYLVIVVPAWIIYAKVRRDKD